MRNSGFFPLCEVCADSSFFNRDVNCIRRFFTRRFGFVGTTWPTWKDVLEEEEAEVQDEAEGAEAKGAGEETTVEGETEDVEDGPRPSEGEPKAGKRLRLDLEVEASGFGRALQRELEDVS
jgi:RIO kinase 2